MHRNLLPLVAVMLAASLVHTAEGALQSLLPIRLALSGQTSFETGLITTSYALGFMIGCFVAPRVIRAVGHIRAYAAFAALAAVALKVFQIAIIPELWAVVRVGMGICLAGLFTVVDSWVNARTSSDVRGQVLSIYAVIITLALAGGQLLLSVDDVLKPTLIMLLSALFTLALVPVCLTRSETPPVPDVTGASIITLWRISPSATVGCFSVGMMSASLIGLLPFFFSSHDVPAALVGYAIMALQLGKLACQWPLGRLSDRLDRRFVIMAACAMMIATLIFVGIVAPGEGVGIRGDAGSFVQMAIFSSLFVLGGTCLTQFAIFGAHAHDYAAPGQSVVVSSSILLTWSAGAIAGPLLCTSAMSVLGIHGMIYFLMGCGAVLLLFVGARVIRREPVPIDARDDYRNVPISSLESARLDPRAEDRLHRVDAGQAA